MAKSLLKVGKKKQKRAVKGLLFAPKFVKGEVVDNSGKIFYHQEIGSKIWVKKISKFLKTHRKQKWNQIKKLPSWKYAFSHWAFYSDALAAGALLEGDSAEWLESRFDDLVAEAKTIKPAKEEIAKKKAYVPSIQEKLREKRSMLMAEMENWEDEGDWDIDVFKWLKDKEVAQMHLKIMMAFWQPKLEEMLLLQKGDPEVSEGFNLSKAVVKRYIALYKRILKDLEAYMSVKSATRKTRVKAQPSKDKQVAKVNYKEEDTEYKVASVNPTGIIGASQVWFFDTVRRQLGVYHVSASAGQLGIKSAGITGYDEETSKMKTCRKPEEVLPLVIKGTKPKLKKLLESLNTAEKNVKSRLNKNTIILRIV